jgi:hypothetical protein
MVQKRQLDGGNNSSAMTVTMPMQREGKEVSAIGNRVNDAPCNVDNGASARGQQRHFDNGEDTYALMTAKT